VSLSVEKAGLLTTIQDLGRPGYRDAAIAAGGAMDSYALRAANLLVGNQEGAAALELTLVGPVLLANCAMLVAICGADMAPKADGEELPMWRPVHIAAGTRLSFGAASAGCRTYLAVAGGIGAGPPMLGSYSTDTRAGLGGSEGSVGRALRAGDQLPLREQASAVMQQPTREKSASWYMLPSAYQGGSGTADNGESLILRAVRGDEYDRLEEQGQMQLWSSPFRVASQSDRMGIRLEGTKLVLNDSSELRSHGVVPGTIQLPPGGSPIILGSDGQTTGGYPKIAHIITADLPLLAQLKPGDVITLSEVSLEEAQEAYRKLERSIQGLKTALRLQRKRE